MSNKEFPFTIRNPHFRNNHFLGVYKELRNMEKERKQRLEIVKRECRFFYKREDAIKRSEKLKKAHGVNKIGVNSKNDRLQMYSNNLKTLVYFIIHVDDLDLEDRLMALEALFITEEPVMLEFLNRYDSDTLPVGLGYHDSNNNFVYHPRHFKQRTVGDAVMTVVVALEDMCRMYQVWGLEDF